MAVPPSEHPGPSRSETVAWAIREGLAVERG
jgi:hypothetical protein